MGSEGQVRKDAVARVLSGEPVRKVALDLGRTERWVRKWVARYDPADEAWGADRSRAPHRVANRTPADVEETVLEIRARLMANQWAQVGAAAIAWEMTKLGLAPPELWTIDRILRRAAVPKRRARSRYVPRGTPYPGGGSRLPAPGAIQEIDLVGPRHLAGAREFYAVNAVDLGLRRGGIQIVRTKQEPDITAALIALWARLGIPRVAKFDNGTTLSGMGRTLAQPVRLCLALGVRPRFIPFGEPWRNPVVEHFNDTFDKRFFRTEVFRDLAHLRRRAAAFAAFHNTHHRYSVLAGKTPAEHQAELGFTPALLDPAFTPPWKLPRRGRVEFIRLVRSDRVVRILGVNLAVPEQLVHRYVTATLVVVKQRLVIHQSDMGWRQEIAFPLNP